MDFKWLSNELLILTSILFVVFSIYFKTLSPSIAGGDSGELAAEGCILGTAHPPGYPIMTLIIYLIKSFSIPESIAFHINIFSSLMTTAAAGCIGYIVWLSSDESIGRLGAIILSIGMFSFSPLIWQYAITAEVFPLNTFFSALICMLVLYFARYKSLTITYLGSLMCGLAICNQHTIILYATPLICWKLYLIHKEIFKNPYIILNLSILFFIGLLPYIGLPILAGMSPKQGSWGDVTSVQGFINHFIRKDYGTFQLFSGESGQHAEGLLSRNMAYLRDVAFVQGMLIVPVLSLVTILTWHSIDVLKINNDQTNASNQSNSTNNTSNNENNNYKNNLKSKNKKFTTIIKNKPIINSNDFNATKYTPIVLTLTWLFYLIVFHSLANLPLSDPLLFGVHSRFWMQPNVLLFAYSGIGYQKLIIYIKHLFNLNSTNHLSLLNLMGAVLATALVAAQCRRNYPLADQSRDGVFFRQYATAILAPLPANSILLANYDQLWTSVRYLQQCEGYRRDVTTINLSMMTYPWFSTKRPLYPGIEFPGPYLTSPGSPHVKVNKAFTLAEFLTANIARYPIFLGGDESYPDPAMSQFDIVPVGLTAQYVPLAALPNASSFLAATQQHLATLMRSLPNLPDPHRYPQATWEWTIGRHFKTRLTDIAAYGLFVCEESKADFRSYLFAVYLLESALVLERDQAEVASSSLPASAATALLKNAGLAHIKLLQHRGIPAALAQAKHLPLPAKADFFSTLSAMNYPHKHSPLQQEWKAWSLDRFLLCWKEFLARPDAAKDPQYEVIKGQYQAVLKVVAPK